MSQVTKAPAQQAAEKPSRDDVHEQRQKGQPAEGVKPAPRPGSQSLNDEARADWEGMAQKPSSPDAAEAKPGGQPTPGKNSLAGKQG